MRRQDGEQGRVELPEPSDQATDCTLEQLRALASELRFEIVSMLAQRDCCVCELEALLGLRQSKVSYHLAALREAGMISSQPRGKNTFYRLEREALYCLGGDLLTVLLRPRPDLGLTD